jgi:dienelactone hydrolase
VVGTADSYYLDGAVHDLKTAFRKVGGRAEFIYVPGASHSINEVHARDGDRNAYYREMARAVYVVARPSKAMRER